MNTVLACGGPLNGQHITAEQAAEHGYELCARDWTTDERLYMMPVVRGDRSKAGLVNRHGDI